MSKGWCRMITDNEDQVVEDEEIILNEDENVEETTENPEVSDEAVEEDHAAIHDDEVTDDEDDEEDDRIVTIGEPEPEEESKEEEHQEAPGWVKGVRKLNRRLESENKRYKKQLEELTKPKEVVLDLGAKPTIASCGYDEAKYDQEYSAYLSRKSKVSEQQLAQKKVVEERAERQQTKATKYVELRKQHNFKGYSDAETNVEDTLSLQQQQIIIQGAEDSALLVYALGNNPKKLEELSKASDPIEFAFKLAKLESQLKVTSRKAPKPERKVSTGKAGGISGNSDKTLDRLREEASKTGDYTKVTAYKNKLRK